MSAELASATELFQSGETARARIICEQRLEENPLDPAALQLLGAICLRERKHTEARAILERVNEVSPGCPLILNNLGLAREYLGGLAAAEQCFRAALDIDPQFAAAYFNLSEVANLGEDDEHASRLIGLLPTAGELHANDRASLYFAAGKAFADRHQFDRAFAAYRHGNDSLRPTYDRASNSDRIAHAIKVFTHELLAQRSDTPRDFVESSFAGERNATISSRLIPHQLVDRSHLSAVSSSD